jgi:spore germination protein
MPAAVFLVWDTGGKVGEEYFQIVKGVSIMKSEVTNRQIAILLFLTLTTYTVINIPKVMAQRAGTGSWLPILAMAVVFSLFAALITKLGNMFQGKMLFDYSREIVGAFMSYVFLIYFIAYFLLICTYLIIELSSVLKAEFFPKTPKWATLTAGVLVFGFIAYKGISGVARFFEIIGPVFIVTSVGVHLIMLTQGNVSNILPLFRASEMPRYLLAAKDAILPFLGVEVLTIIPFSPKNGKKAIRTAFLTLLFIGLFYVLIVETSIMMLGIHDIQNYNYALIEAIKLVNNPVLERFDILYLTVGFAGLIAGICALFLALTEYVCKLLSGLSRKAVVIMLTALVIVSGIIGINLKNAQSIFESVIPPAGLFTAFLIPALLFVIAKVRGLGQKAR